MAKDDWSLAKHVLDLLEEYQKTPRQGLTEIRCCNPVAVLHRIGALETEVGDYYPYLDYQNLPEAVLAADRSRTFFLPVAWQIEGAHRLHANITPAVGEPRLYELTGNGLVIITQFDLDSDPTSLRQIAIWPDTSSSGYRLTHPYSWKIHTNFEVSKPR